MATQPSAPSLDPQALAELEAKLDSLNLQLQRLNRGLKSDESDLLIEPKLQAVNADIAELRRQWRALLGLTPPKQ